MDLHEFLKDFRDFWAWESGALWHPVAPSGTLWHLWRAVAASCGPYILPCSVLGAGRLAGWRLAGWLDGWMAGWLDG